MNETLFFGLDHARQKLIAWAADYNTERFHSVLGYQTAAAYAAHLTATRGVTTAETLVIAG